MCLCHLSESDLLSTKQLLAMPPETAAGNCDVVRARSFPVTLFETQKNNCLLVHLSEKSTKYKSKAIIRLRPLEKEHDLNLKRINLCVSKLTSATPKISVEGVEKICCSHQKSDILSTKQKSGPVELEWFYPSILTMSKNNTYFQGVQVYYISIGWFLRWLCQFQRLIF